MCLIVSVDRTVEIPNRLAKNDETVDFPVPEVPPINIMIGICLSKFFINIRLTYD